MHSKLVLLGGLAAVAFIVAACGTGTGSYGAAPGTTPTSQPSTAPVVAAPSATASPRATGTAIAVGNSRLGPILVDSSGRSLYLFVADSGTASTCNSASCVQNWPPFLTTGAPQALNGVNPSLLGTTSRGDHKDHRPEHRRVWRTLVCRLTLGDAGPLDTHSRQSPRGSTPLPPVAPSLMKPVRGARRRPSRWV